MKVYLTYFLHFAFSTIFTFLILKKFIPSLYKIFPATPTRRGMHHVIKPSSGGITFILPYIILTLYQGFYLPLLSLPLVLIGILDDKYNISKIFRLFIQFINLLVIIIYLKNDSSTFVSTVLFDNIFIFILFIIFGTLIVNSINFMDGIDGLITGSMIIIFATLNIKFHFLLPIIGTLTAFLYFNWFPSKVFMGDSGSLFLGSYLVSLIYSSNDFIEIVKILLLCSPLLLDSFICILRRIKKNHNIFKSHKLHLYQRLVSGGLKHSNVSLIYMGSILFLSFFYIFTNIMYLSLATLLILSLGIFLDKKYAVNFNKNDLNNC